MADRMTAPGTPILGTTETRRGLRVGGWQRNRPRIYRRSRRLAGCPTHRPSSGVWITMYNLVQHELFKPYVHGIVLTVAYQDPVPKNLDWSNVSIIKR